ncbi:MAG TPA: 6-phosphogluconolactonase [Candidatus Limnocylindrales bacterium]
MTGRTAAATAVPAGRQTGVRAGRQSGVPAGRQTAVALDRATEPGDPRVVVVRRAHDVSTLSARLIAEAIDAAVRARGIAHLALTGGSTAGGVYRALSSSAMLEMTPWHRTHLWWGDDRFVPRGNHLSNVWLADTELFVGHHVGRGIPIPPENIHPFPVDEALATDAGNEACAATLAREAAVRLPAGDHGYPVFDLVLLGIGGDGHLLSCFPGSAAFDTCDWALGIPKPSHIAPHVPRMTFNPAIVVAGRAVLAMANGEGKASILGSLFREDRDVRRRPAQIAQRASATWVLDEDAAGLLPEDVLDMARGGGTGD